MAFLTIENGNIYTRPDLTSAATGISYPNAVALDLDKTLDSNVFAIHQTYRISICDLNNPGNAYFVTNLGGVVSFPVYVVPNCFKSAGYLNLADGITTVRYFVTPASDKGLLFIQLTFINNILSNVQYISDTSFRPSGVGNIVQIQRGAARFVSNSIGSGFWYDLVLVLQNGSNFDFAYLNQIPTTSSTTPFLINSNNVIVNTWLTNTLYTIASPGPNGAINAASNPNITWDNATQAYYFAQGNLSVFPGSALSTSPNINYPSVEPILSGTRNFVDFSHQADPNAFDASGNPLSNWTSFAITQVKSNTDGVIYTDAVNKYINSVAVSS
jgi:hypothetical protein